MSYLSPDVQFGLATPRITSYHAVTLGMRAHDTMPTLPNLHRAVVGVEKLRDYILNMDHPQGRHKAIVFKSMLGIEGHHAHVLAEVIRGTLGRALAQRGQVDEFGERWATYHEIIGLNGQSAILTVAWMFKREDSDIPVLISSYIELEQQGKLAKLLRDERQK
jgi:hypothetical protein